MDYVVNPVINHPQYCCTMLLDGMRVVLSYLQMAGLLLVYHVFYAKMEDVSLPISTLDNHLTTG